MTYIQEEIREEFRPIADAARDACINDANELTFALTLVIEQYRDAHGDSYNLLNDIVGALEVTKLEFYRRVAAKQQDKQSFANGDVFIF